MLEVMRISCDHSGRQILLTCDGFFKIAWHVSQGKVVQQQPFLKMCVSKCSKEMLKTLKNVVQSLLWSSFESNAFLFEELSCGFFLLGEDRPTSVSEIPPRSLTLTREAS